MTLLFELVKVLPPVIFKWVIDAVVIFDPAKPFSLNVLEWLILGYFGSLIVMTVVEMVTKQVTYNRITRIEYDLTSRAMEKLLKLDLEYHVRQNTGTSINKVMGGVQRVKDLLYLICEQLVPSVLQSGITLAILFYAHWLIGISFVIFVPLFIIILLRGSVRTQPLREAYHKEHELLAGVVTQSVANIRTVKDFDAEGAELEQTRGVLARYVDLINRRTRQGLRSMLWEDIIINVARFVTLALSVWLLTRGQLTAGSLVLVMTLSEKAYLNLARLSRAYYRMQDSGPSIERLKRINEEPIVVKDNPQAPHKIVNGRVVFEGVSFRYGGSGDALKNVSFEVPERSVAAFVGRSGAGKSTVMKLLLRHADVSGGKILIDGTPINEYSFENLRAGISIVSQDVELFNDTIAGNIAYGALNASKAEIVRASKLAHAHEFIVKFPQGYDTMVGERGVKLSGGQKQRIAIARALVTNPKILIFDEATSSLDSESERYIHKSIVNLSGKLTLLIIAHRFSTIEHADKIILLEDGKVAEVGSHKELMAKKGIFARLRKLQELGEVFS